MICSKNGGSVGTVGSEINFFTQNIAMLDWSGTLTYVSTTCASKMWPKCTHIMCSCKKNVAIMFTHNVQTVDVSKRWLKCTLIMCTCIKKVAKMCTYQVQMYQKGGQSGRGLSGLVHSGWWWIPPPLSLSTVVQAGGEWKPPCVCFTMQIQIYKGIALQIQIKNSNTYKLDEIGAEVPRLL